MSKFYNRNDRYEHSDEVSEMEGGDPDRKNTYLMNLYYDINNLDKNIALYNTSLQRNQKDSTGNSKEDTFIDTEINTHLKKLNDSIDKFNTDVYSLHEFEKPRGLSKSLSNVEYTKSKTKYVLNNKIVTDALREEVNNQGLKNYKKRMISKIKTDTPFTKYYDHFKDDGTKEEIEIKYNIFVDYSYTLNYEDEYQHNLGIKNVVDAATYHASDVTPVGLSKEEENKEKEAKQKQKDIDIKIRKEASEKNPIQERARMSAIESRRDKLKTLSDFQDSDNAKKERKRFEDSDDSPKGPKGPSGTETVEEMWKKLEEAIILAMQQHENPYKYMKIIENLLTNNSPYPTFTKNKDDNFLSHSRLCGKKVPGEKCINLLQQCLNGETKKCVKAWNELNWADGVDFKDADRGSARKLAIKLGLDKKSVDDVVKELESASGSTLAETVKVAFKSIKNMINPESRITIPKKRQIIGVQQRDTSDIGNYGFFGNYGFRGGTTNMYGGGATGSYSNFVRSIDALNNNHSMIGGLYIKNTANMTRSVVAEFVSLLKNKGKQIEQEDLDAINDEIDSLERSEKRVIQAGQYIEILNKAIKSANLDLSSVKGNMTLKLIEELAEKKKTSESSMTKKYRTINELLTTLNEIVTNYEQNNKKTN